MKDKIKSIITILLIISALFQAFLYNSFNLKQTPVPEVVVKKESKTLSELIKGLDCLENKKILAAEEINSKWHIKLKIYGIKDTIINEISKLNQFDINSYRITKKNNGIYIELEISGKS